MNNYAILGITPKATPEEIDYAFKKKLTLSNGDIEETLALHVAYGELQQVRKPIQVNQSKPKNDNQSDVVISPIPEVIKFDIPNSFQHNHTHTHYYPYHPQCKLQQSYYSPYGTPVSSTVGYIGLTFLLVFLGFLIVS